MQTTPIFDLPYPELSDDSNAPEQIQALAVALETALASATTGPKFRAFRSAAQTGISSGVVTRVNFNAETFDASGYFDPVTNFRFQPGIPGKWMLHAKVSLNGLGDGKFLIGYIYKNGAIAAVRRTSNGGTLDADVTVTDIIHFNGTSDYVEVYVEHNHGSNLATVGGSPFDYFTGHYLGA